MIIPCLTNCLADKKRTAYIDRGYLESHGIPAEVECDALSEIFPAPGSGVGSIRLIVPDQYADEAQRLMRDRD